MADKPQEQQQQQAEQMEPQLIVHTQYVKDISFESPKAPQSLMDAATKDRPEVEISINVGANPQEADRQFEVLLSVNATAKRENDTLFIAELSYAAVISVGAQVDEKIIHPIVMIEGPRMIFPFVRQLLADITQAGGFTPINLQPIDFARIYQAGLQQQQQRQAEGNGGASAIADDTIDTSKITEAANGKAKAAKKAAKGGKKAAKKK